MRIITFKHSKVIDDQVTYSWDVGVFNSTFMEYKMQSQLYQATEENIAYQDLITEKPEAEKLQAMLLPSVVPYIQMMDKKLIDVTDITGHRFMTFSQYGIELLNSNRLDHSQHQLRIDFISDEYRWIDTIGDQMIIQPITEIEKVYVVMLSEVLTIYNIKYV